MKSRQLLFLTLLLPVMAASENAGSDFEAVGRVLDDFHDAAARGDKERYLNHLTKRAVYMGTDEWERWPKHPDFSEYVDGRFWGWYRLELQIRGEDDSFWRPIRRSLVR